MDMCADMFIDMHVDMCVDMFADMCADMCIDMRVEMCACSEPTSEVQMKSRGEQGPP